MLNLVYDYEHPLGHSGLINRLRISQRVTFRTQDGVDQFGVITKYNRKSVTVITDSGHQWNIAPGFLREVPSKKNDLLPLASGANVLTFPQKALKFWCNFKTDYLES
jgi:hypothetical protein